MEKEKTEWLPAKAWNDSWEEKTGTDALADWLKKATRPVYWPPDRRRVRRELQDHIDERVEGLQNRGLSLGDARRETLKRMGDPAETGALLRQVHQPWLGWALGVARIVAIGLLLAVVVMLVSGEYNLPRITKSHSVISSRSIDYGDYVENYTLVAERSCTCTDKVQFGAFTVTCGEAVCRYDRLERVLKKTGQQEELSEKIIKSQARDSCVIRLDYTAPPWYKMAFPSVRVVDDKGVEYELSSRSWGRTGLCSWDEYISLADCPEKATWLDIILGEKASEKKLRVHLGDWKFQNLDTLPSEPQDFIENFQNIELKLNGVVWEQRRWYDEQQGQMVGEPLFQLGHFEPAEGQTGGIRVSVSKACYMGEEYAKYRFLSSEAPAYGYPAGQWFMDWTLVFRGNTEQLPLFTTSLRERLRIVDPTRGPDAQEIEFIPIGTRIYHNLCVWRIVWKESEGAEHYELQYRQSPEEEPCVLRLDLETDVKEEENP